MEVKIRDLDIRAVNVLDDEAKKQGVSRNELLKRHVEDLVMFNGIKQTEKALDRTLNKVGTSLEMTFHRLDKLEKQSMKMYLLLAVVLDMDPEEADDYLHHMFNLNIEGGAKNE